MEGGGCPDRV